MNGSIRWVKVLAERRSRASGLVSPRLFFFLLAGPLGWSAGLDARENERWWLCTEPAAMSRQLSSIAARIAARTAAGQSVVEVSATPQDEGSQEFLLASVAEVFEQLRSQLLARKVPQRRVVYRWGSPSEGAAPGVEAAACGAVMVLVELAGPPK